MLPQEPWKIRNRWYRRRKFWKGELKWRWSNGFHRRWGNVLACTDRHSQTYRNGWHIAHFLVWMEVLGRKLAAPSSELSAKLVGWLELRWLWRVWNIKSAEPNGLGTSLALLIVIYWPPLCGRQCLWDLDKSFGLYEQLGSPTNQKAKSVIKDWLIETFML